jgi:hypothetical protein
LGIGTSRLVGRHGRQHRNSLCSAVYLRLARS